MEDELRELKAKVSTFEKQIHGYKIGLIVFGIAASMFIYYQWNEIPKKAEQAVQTQLTEEIHLKLTKAAKEAEIILEAGEAMRSRGSNVEHVIMKGQFWNLNKTNTVGHICSNKEFLTGVKFTMESINDVRTPTKITYYCASKVK